MRELEQHYQDSEHEKYLFKLFDTLVNYFEIEVSQETRANFVMGRWLDIKK